jgi:hypothetical protein
VKVQGQPYNGTGLFKFSILNTSGTSTLWSNDGTGIGLGSAEPSTSISLQVADGIFNVLIGDSTLMQSVSPTLFQSRNPLKLRVWFNDGSHGFQQLAPDHNLVDVTLAASDTGASDLTIYVNGTSGNDRNNGLTPATAKKTIQAAVDILPDRINANVTVDIANGTYREEVKIHGFSILPGKALTFLGDETWTPTAVGMPGVVLSGGTDAVTTGVRQNAVHASQCAGIVFIGLAAVDAGSRGFWLENGEYKLYNCLASGNGSNGIIIGTQAHGEMTNCIAKQNLVHGHTVTGSSTCDLTSCTGILNGYAGLSVNGTSLVGLHDKGDYSSNGQAGIHCIYFSSVTCFNYAGSIKNNARYAIVAWNSFLSNVTGTNTITGNGSANSALTFSGGQTNY